MRNFLLILILTFSFQSLTKADDINDLQIEGMSIGENILDFFTIKDLKNFGEGNYPASDKFYDIYTHSEKYTQYDSVGINLKKNNYLIYGISGSIFIKNIDECKKKKNEIQNEIISQFIDSKIIDHGTYTQKDYNDNDSTKTQVEIHLPNKGGLISIECSDWSKKTEASHGWYDNLSVSIYSKEFEKWLRNEAY